MNTLNEILTKKDYAERFFGDKRDSRQISQNSEKRLMLKVFFVLFIVLAAMGDQKVLNSLYGGIPKVISVGAIALAFFYGIYKSDYKSLKKILVPVIMYILLLVLIMVYSLIIWILGFTELSSIMRGSSKLLYQLIAVLVAVSGVYLFGRESIKLFFISFCMCYSIIMLIEMPKYGFIESVLSIFNAVITFGEARGYARMLEIHDQTYVMGLYVVYFILFAPRDTKAQRKERIICIILSIFYFLVGMKRIAIVAAGLAIVVGLIIKRRKNLNKIIIYIGIAMVVGFFLFLYTVRTGSFTTFLDVTGINMMGRDSAWQMAANYYEFSPLFLGHGFESVDALVKSWAEQGLTNKPLPLHNDFLKVFIELGFYGFTIWLITQYLVYPIIWLKLYDTATGCVYICILIYMSVTFMTDNTAFLFWSTMALRLFPMAYASGVEKTKPAAKWNNPTSREINYRLQEIYEGKS